LVPSQEAIEQWERVSPALLATIGQQRYNTWAAPILLSTITRYDNGSVCWHFLVANEHFQRRWREMEIHIVNAAKVAGISEKIFCEFELKPN
jgi:hypothetical protein